jgi:hypothetical protein
MKKSIDVWRRCEQGVGVTHLLLDGGTLSVKEADEPEFHKAYVNDLVNGERLFVVEKKTPHFRFFVDVDYVGDSELDFEKVCKELFSIVDLGPCYIAKAPRRITPNGTKYGVHVIWPESIVDKPMAQSIRLKIIRLLGGDDMWEKIIDSSVYSGSGLRMLWSLKNEPGSTHYVPWAKIKDATNFEIFSNVYPCTEFLKKFSIRATNSTTITSSYSKEVSQPTNDLEEFIRINLPGQERARVLKISKCKKSENGLWVSTDSRYCENVKKEHKSNHVWFNVRRLGNSGWYSISQKCQDEECKEYMGRLYRFPSRLITNEGILDSSTHRIISDYFPDGWKKV